MRSLATVFRRAVCLLPAVLGGSLIAASPGLSADFGVKKPTPAAPAASMSCYETTAVPNDVFGVTTGSDVNDYQQLSGSLEYDGAYKTRFGHFAGNLVKGQLSYSPFRCVEIGPYIQGTFNRTSVLGVKTDVDAFGGGIEMKYKVLGRDVHGVGLTFVFDPNINRYSIDQRLSGIKLPGGDGNSINTTARMLMDVRIAPKLYGALNLEYLTNFTGDPSYVRASGFNVRAALTYQFLDNLYLGVEGSHQRAYAGTFLNRDLGYGWFVGPTWFWQINDKVAFTGSYNIQVAGRARAEARDLNLTNFNQHVVKAKLAFSF